MPYMLARTYQDQDDYRGGALPFPCEYTRWSKRPEAGPSAARVRGHRGGSPGDAPGPSSSRWGIRVADRGGGVDGGAPDRPPAGSGSVGGLREKRTKDNAPGACT